MKLRGADGKYKPLAGLSDIQTQAIFMLVYENKTNREIYEELGIPKSTWYSFFKQDLFTEELAKVRNAKFKEMSNKALKKLDELLESSDARTAVRAVEMVLKENNHLKDNINLNTNATQEIKITLFDSEDEETEE
jgi:hypothetical protein